jgi:sugar phosphate isomerase/epimerase
MKLSLSVRIAEGFLSKEIPLLDLESVVQIAIDSGYGAICMRASQIGVQSPEASIARAHELLVQSGVAVSMVTGDFNMVYNNDAGPSVLRNIEPYLALASRLNAKLIRVALKNDDDIPWARNASDAASEHGIRLVHQCHTLSLFETVDSILRTLERIDRPNFGLIYEPANLQICGQDYGSKTIERLAPWIFNVYLQNQFLSNTGNVCLETWCNGLVRLNVVPIHATGGIDFAEVFAGLNRIQYDGFVTVHQSATEGETPIETASRTSQYLRALQSF